MALETLAVNLEDDALVTFATALAKDAAAAQRCLLPFLYGHALALDASPGLRREWSREMDFLDGDELAADGSVRDEARRLLALVTEVHRLSEDALSLFDSLRIEAGSLPEATRDQLRSIVARLLEIVGGEGVNGNLQSVALTFFHCVSGLSATEIGDLYASETGVTESRVDSLSGTEFERLVAALLDRMGFETEITRATADGGIDIVATMDKFVVGGRVLVQCKRYAPGTPVGAALVREFYGALSADRSAVKGILVTTSDFTSQARAFAGESRIELIGRRELLELLVENGLLDQGTTGGGLTQLQGAIVDIVETTARAVSEWRE